MISDTLRLYGDEIKILEAAAPLTMHKPKMKRDGEKKAQKEECHM